MWAAPKKSIPDSNIVNFFIFPTDIEQYYSIFPQILDFLQSKVKDYIWQEEPFSLQPSNEIPSNFGFTSLTSNTKKLTGWWGNLRYGENIEDEWFMVELLLEMTKIFPVVVRIMDDDGEFILIEAAMALPRWVRPENSEGRVWLKGGKIHLIPKSHIKFNLPEGSINLDVGLGILKDANINCEASKEIQQSITKRINQAKEYRKVENHYANCYVPDIIAYILYKDPQMISKAVNAYYYRDPLQMRVCKKMEKFHNENKDNKSNCDMHIIRFTRCLYAMLHGQQLDFIPHTYKPIEDSNPHKYATELGYKLVCGFEVLYQESKKRKYREEGEISEHEVIDRILENAPQPLKDNIHSHKKTPDSDEWMKISSEEIDDLILQKQKEMEALYNTQKEKKKENVEKKDVKVENPPQTKKVDDEDGAYEFMVNEMKNFLGKMSGYEGIMDDPEGESEEDEDFYDFGEEDISEFDSDMRSLMSRMDEELNNTTMRDTFERREDNSVDENFNLLKNFLVSHDQQQGRPGPLTTLFSKQNKK